MFHDPCSRRLGPLLISLSVIPLAACGIADELPQSIELTVTAVGPSAVELSWTAAPELNQGYWLYRDGVQVKTYSQAGAVVYDQDLAPDSSHTWRILAYYLPVGGVAVSPVVSAQTPALAPWIREPLSPEEDIASRPVLALDGGGAPRVAYADESAGELVVARRAANGWTGETVASAAGLRSIALRYDAAGTAHIAYVAADGVLRYGRRVLIGWQLEPIAEGSIRACALALNEAGAPQVVYVDASGAAAELRLARRLGLSWAIESVPGATPVVGDPLALGAPEGLHVAWLAPDGEQLALHHASDASGAWASELVASTVRGEPAMARAADGTLGLAWLDADSFDLLLSTPVSGGWNAELVATLTDVGGGLALSAPPAGGFALSFRDGFDQLAQAVWPEWTTAIVDVGLIPGARISAAVGADGRAHVAYELPDGYLDIASSP